MDSLIEKYLPDNICSMFAENSFEGKRITEIRIRPKKPIFITANNKEYILMLNKAPYIATEQDLRKTVELISNYSLYAWEDELRNGFITLQGGHRVGICGKVIVENANIKSINQISSLNFRIAHEIRGCGEKIFELAGSEPGNILVISPPGCGKTTIIRDLVRIISDGIAGEFHGKTVGVADERSEIAGVYMGIPQNYIGLRTDVLDRCPKAAGMLMILRSMSPKYIAADEIGSKEDAKAIETIVNSGVKLICSVHAASIDELKSRPYLKDMLENKIFDTYVLLSSKKGAGTLEGIYNKSLQRAGKLCT